MFDSTVELISQAASNSLFIFFFCNLIIVMILIGSKSGSNYDQESQIPISMVPYRDINVKQGQGIVAKHSFDGNTTVPPTKAKHSVDIAGDRTIPNSCEESRALELPGDDCDEEDGSDNEDDELRRRVEEFIQKVNREWREELQRTTQFV